MKKKTLICYLFTGFDKISSLKKFIDSYKKYKSGYQHDLLICYKLINEKKINKLEKEFVKINHIKYVDVFKENDWDFGSYSRVAKKYFNRTIFFMNSHSYPIKNNWLKKFMKHYEKKTIISSSGSYESITNQVKFKKSYNIISYIKKKIKAKKAFTEFPNPHLNTANFLINGNDLYKYLKNKRFNNKYDTWKIESGFDSLTRFFKKKKFRLFVVNSEGEKFYENNWMYSETYHYKDQSKSLMSDKHSRKYLKLNKLGRSKSQKAVWGI
jgi:hypothetical protein